MTSGRPNDSPSHAPPPDPRLSVKSATAVGGQVDGAWWPRSDDAVAEFPGLVMALSSWIGPITRVDCHFDAWGLVADKLVIKGWPVALADLPALPAHTVMVTGADDRRMTILVIPPGTPGGAARAVLRTAAARDTVATAGEILSGNGVPLPSSV